LVAVFIIYGAGQLLSLHQRSLKIKSIKKKLRADELTIGSWITIGDPCIAEIMAKAGFDWLAANIKHNTVEYHESNNSSKDCF